MAGLGASALLPRVGWAADVQASLHDDSGWSHVSTHASGTQVYTKDIPAVELPAWKGVYALDVDSEELFSLVCDLEGHVDVSDQLLESRVIASRGMVTDFYQVMKSPGPLISKRFWLNRSRTYRDHSGPGCHRRTWDALAEDKYTKVRDVLAENYPDAVVVTFTHGSWEITPDQLIYRTVSHPGGNVPPNAFATLSGKNLPNNMMNFVDHIKAR